MAAAPDSKTGHMFCDSCWHKQFPQIKSFSIFHTEGGKSSPADWILSNKMTPLCFLNVCVKKQKQQTLLMYLNNLEIVSEACDKKNCWEVI